MQQRHSADSSRMHAEAGMLARLGQLLGETRQRFPPGASGLQVVPVFSAAARAQGLLSDAPDSIQRFFTDCSTLAARQEQLRQNQLMDLQYFEQAPIIDDPRSAEGRVAVGH